MKTQFDVTVNLMDESDLYYIAVMDQEEECYFCEEINEIMLGYTWNENDFTQLAAENNCIIVDGEIFFKEEDAEKVKNIIVNSLKETKSYKSIN